MSGKLSTILADSMPLRSPPRDKIDLPRLNGITSKAIICQCQNQRRAFNATRKERNGRADHPLCCERSKSRWDEVRPLPMAVKKIGLTEQTYS